MTQFLVNNTGGYFLSGISSRYSGLFLLINEKMIKILDDNFSKEKIIMPEGSNLLVINSKKYKDLHLDVKESYDNSEFGRFYDFENNLITFSKKTGDNIDSQIFIAIDCKEIKKQASKVIEIRQNIQIYERMILSKINDQLMGNLMWDNR